MYGMVVVDDKEDIVKGITRLGDWGSVGIEIKGTASNGVEALDIVKRTSPKILITDIRMPLMDGLELTQKVKEFDKNIKIILLSGYDEFTYAQQAVKLGAQEYLLKPASIESIVQAVLRSKEQIALEERKFLEDIKLKQILKESLPLLKNEYFSYLVSSPAKDIKKMEEKLNYLGIELEAENFKIMVISLDDYERISASYSFRDYDLLMFAVINIVEETFGGFCRNVVFKSGKSEVTVIMNMCSSDVEGEVFSIAELCRDRIMTYLDLSVSIGLGRRYREPDGIHLSYREAVRAVESRFVFGRNSVIDINDIDIGSNIKFEYPYSLEQELIQYIRVGAVQRAEEIYEQYITEICSSTTNVPELTRRYLIQLIIVLSKDLMENGIELNRIIGDELEYVKRLEILKTLGEVTGELRNVVVKITEYILNLRKINEKNNIDVIDEFIRENYMKDISLNDIAKLVYISPSYISTLIKEHFGESFVERITRLRIEHAKVLLLSSSDKVYEVAEKVGYSDRRYFSDIFKKYTGLTPKEYIDKYR